jgi:hypothetical protein
MRTVSSKSKRTARVVNNDVLTPNGIYILGSDEADDLFDDISTFYVEVLFDQRLGFSARKEVRSGKDHWYAYKRQSGVLLKRYIGQQISMKNLWDAAAAMVLQGTSQYALFNQKRRK